MAQVAERRAVIVPDPRWFGLHELRLLAQDERDPFKHRKDREQGHGVLGAVAEAMPRCPLREASEDEIPPKLAPAREQWRAHRRG
jgi:hypothetical protein